MAKSTDSGPLTDKNPQLNSFQKMQIGNQLRKPNSALAMTQKISGLTEHNPAHVAAVNAHIQNLKSSGKVQDVQGGSGGYQLSPPAENE
jgi:hypothetical protein